MNDQLPGVQTSIAHELLSFETIGTDALKRVELLKRMDRKYLVPIAQLPLILQRVAPHYKVLEVQGRRQFEYETEYLDTDDFLFYFQHHNYRANRQKIRYRYYKSSGSVYLEVKSRRIGRTVKERLKLSGLKGTPSETSFIDQRLSGLLTHHLGIKAKTHYYRTTLVHKTLPERVTIDVNLRFTSPTQDLARELSEVAIIEIKNEKPLPTEMIGVLRTIKSYRTSFSKYCIGSAMLYPGLKHNRFKPQLLIVNRIAHGYDLNR
jgi:hypothetical protein